MGPKPFIAFPPSTRLAAKVMAVGVFTLLVSCISDGPNRTGGGYLGEHGVLLQNPLYHVVIPDFPVDSLWTRDGDQQGGHLGAGVLFAGVSGQFSAQVRLGYDVTDTAYLKSLADTTDSVRLSVRAFRSVAGLGALEASVGDSILANDTTKADPSTRFADTLSFLVETWAFRNKDASGTILTDEQRLDSVNLRNRKFLARMDPNAILDPYPILDTIKLSIRKAYKDDSLQARVLPHLTKVLKDSAYTIKWLLHIQLTPLPKPGDTRAAMLRLEGATTTPYAPVLLFGNQPNPVTASAAGTVGQALLPLVTGTSRGVNYVLRYGGSKLDILPSKNRDLHLVLSRAALIDSINAGLRRNLNIEPSPGDIGGNFDLTYFVPFARLSMPLADSLNLEGKLPELIQVLSDLDTLLPNAPPATGHLAVTLVPLESTVRLFIATDQTNSYVPLDTISIAYAKPSATDSLLRRVIVKFALDTAQNDTSYLHVGESKDIVKNVRGYGIEQLFLNLTAGNTALDVSHYLNAHERVEPNDFRDPATGATLSDLASRIPHLLHPKTDSLNLRATIGLQRLLNRTDAGSDVLSDLVIRAQSAVDTAVVATDGTAASAVPFPVLSVIPPRLNAGKLTVRLDLYLYPLKKER